MINYEGTLNLKVVPSPRTLFMRTFPFALSTTSLMADIPIPRPDTSLISLLVENSESNKVRTNKHPI
jgi:hypothetical protein